MECTDFRRDFFPAVCTGKRNNYFAPPYWNLRIECYTVGLNALAVNIPRCLPREATLLDVGAIVTGVIHYSKKRLNADAFDFMTLHGVSFPQPNDWGIWTASEFFSDGVAKLKLELKDNSMELYANTVLNPCEECTFCRHGKVCKDIAFGVVNMPGIVRINYEDIISATAKHVEKMGIKHIVLKNI
jgi:hypothetical protein